MINYELHCCLLMDIMDNMDSMIFVEQAKTGCNLSPLSIPSTTV